MKNPPVKPRIYVVCLAAQFSGQAHGAWLEVGESPWQLWEGVRDMLLESPATNSDAFAIQDYEGFGATYIAPFTGLDVVAALAVRQAS